MGQHPSKPKARRIAEAHLRSSERGARLLAAAGGDAEHADRIDRVLDDLRSNARPADVIQLPKRPYDREAELELERGRPRLDSFLAVFVWALAGLGAWALVVALGFGLYELVQAVG
jgi:hypothetical protein